MSTRGRAAVSLFAVILFSGRLEAEEIPESWRGCWRAVGDPEAYLRFEPTRASRLRGGKLEAFLARSDEGRAVLNSSGHRLEWAVTLEGEELLVSQGDGVRRYRRVAEIPAAFEPAPMKLGRSRQVKPSRVKEIEAELQRRERRDQEVRNDPAREKEVATVDAENTAWLLGTVEELGWIDAKRFGEMASRAAWLLVTHSGDLPLMLAALPEIEKDVKAKRFRDGFAYASLFDRVRLHLGMRQRYGTQIVNDDSGRFVVFPLEDRARVDKLRREIGLGPLAQEIESHRRWTDGAEVSIQDEV